VFSVYDGRQDIIGGTGGTYSTNYTYQVTPLAGGTVYSINALPTSSDGAPLTTVTNTVTGSGSSLTLFPGDSGAFTLNFDTSGDSEGSDYSLSNSGNSNDTISNVNTFTQNNITTTFGAGTPQTVTFSLTGAPSGVTYSFSPTSCSTNCTSTLTFTVAPNAQPGTYPITVNGSYGGISTGFNLVLSAPQGISGVSCNANPAVAKVGKSVTWTANVTGGTPPYTYSWSGTDIPGAPNVPTSNPYNITYSTVGSKNATATITDSNGVNASCQMGTAIVNVNPTFQEF
jgi:hypothetical protein